MRQAPNRRRALLAAWSLSLALAACGGGDPQASATPPVAPPVAPATVTIGGTAAVGAALVGSTVTARCSDASAVAPVTTDATGHWTMTLASAGALPCALEVSGGTASGVTNPLVLHSLASAEGNANLTPLTDLVLAVAAQATPSDWFSGLGAGQPPALGSALDAARTRVVGALTAAGYTLPAASGFDPLSASFTAQAGDAYDGLLDVFARSLAASGTSYAQLLSDVLGAGGATLQLPAAGLGVPGTGGSGGSANAGGIVLAAKSGVQPADLTTLVGDYTGSFGSTTATGQSAAPAASCNIQVSAGGQVSITAGGSTLSAPVNGDVGDQIVTFGHAAKAYAFDFDTNTNVMVEVVRGYVVGALATSPGGNVACTLANPHISTVGSITSSVVNGATAADFETGLAGEYRQDGCAVSISDTGHIHVVAGSVDMTGTLGGDEQDTINVNSAYGLVLMVTTDALSDGRSIVMSFSRTAANPAIGQAVSYGLNVEVDQPRPVQRLASCQQLVKQ